MAHPVRADELGSLESVYLRTVLVSVNLRPNASLGRVLDDLGATLLELVYGDADKPGDMGGVAIHDPLEEPVLPQNALVLGVGLRDPDEIAALLRTLGRQDAAGLVVRSPVPRTDALGAAAAESGVALHRPHPGRILGAARGTAAVAAGRGRRRARPGRRRSAACRPATCSPSPTRSVPSSTPR